MQHCRDYLVSLALAICGLTLAGALAQHRSMNSNKRRSNSANNENNINYYDGKYCNQSN